jgi:hypothetical protein
VRWKPGRFSTVSCYALSAQDARWGTAWIESFNGRLRDESLHVEWFGSLHHARERLAQWRNHYNLQRRHSALDDRTPASFAGDHAASAARFTPIEQNTGSNVVTIESGPHGTYRKTIEGFLIPDVFTSVISDSAEGTTPLVRCRRGMSPEENSTPVYIPC